MIKYLCFLFIFMLFSAGCSRYDAKTPDTRNNRNGFARVTGIAPGADITEIYFYADETGFDPLYCFAFRSSPQAAQRLIAQLNLKKGKNCDWNDPFPVPGDLFWWNSDERKTSEFYSTQLEKTETACYFWYNSQTEKCQFMMVCF